LRALNLGFLRNCLIFYFLPVHQASWRSEFQPPGRPSGLDQIPAGVKSGRFISGANPLSSIPTAQLPGGSAPVDPLGNRPSGEPGRNFSFQPLDFDLKTV
jgi:hypothetical protein